MSQQSWVEKAERFARTRAQLRQILARSQVPLDMAAIYCRFKDYFRYLPDLERRMRELVRRGEVTKYNGSIPTYKLSEE